MSHKSRSISGSSCESQRIYNQRRYIHKLEKENQQLKGSLETYEILLKANDIGKLQQQLDLYKSVLDEIREYITNNRLFNFVLDEEELFEYASDGKAKSELLQILDKGVKKCQ